jgi:hypothetical protein
MDRSDEEDSWQSVGAVAGVVVLKALGPLARSKVPLDKFNNEDDQRCAQGASTHERQGNSRRAILRMEADPSCDDEQCELQHSDFHGAFPPIALC